MLHPNFPVIEGRCQMTDDWTLTLDQQHNRRIEDGSLVIWRPEFTVWINVWTLKEGETPEQRFQIIKEDVSPEAQGLKEETSRIPLRLSYSLNEESEDKRQPAFYGYAVSPSSHVQIAIYFDQSEDKKKAEAIFLSLSPSGEQAHRLVN